MSDLLNEIALQSSGLEAATNAATASLGLTPDEFAWYRAEFKRPMKPQTILPDSDVVLDSYTSSATVFGGLAENNNGDFHYGDIRADISEQIAEGFLHQSGKGANPVPYIPRLLTMKKGLVIVDTPTLNPSLNDGPLVIEGLGRSPRFRKTTIFNTQTGDLTFKHGELLTDGHGWKEDRTVEQNVFDLPDEIVLPRLATVIRTIKTTSYLLTQVASRNVSDVSWDITEEKPSY